MNEGIDYFEAREEASRMLRKVNPRHPELIYVKNTINGRSENVLKKMVLEPELIDMQEYGGLQDFFNAIESYLIAGMKARGYRSVKRTQPLPGTLMFSKELSIDPTENL